MDTDGGNPSRAETDKSGSGRGAEMIGSACSVSAVEDWEASLCESGCMLNGTGVDGGVVIQGGGEGEGEEADVAAAVWKAFRCTRCFWKKRVFALSVHK